MQIKHFLPSKGLVAVVGIKDPSGESKSYHKWIDLSRPDAEEWIEGAVEQLRVSNGCEAFYWSEGSYQFKNGEKMQRRADKTAWFRSYVVDIDCHGNEGEFRSVREAMRAVIAFSETTELTPSAVVFTGRGLQVIWTLTKDIKPAAWLEWADRMWSLVLHFELKGDPTRRRDRASVFRMPGTVNTKSGEEARIVFQGPSYSQEDMDRRIEQICWEHAVEPVITLEAPANQDAAEEGTVYKCQENSNRLKYLLSVTPAHFDDEVGRGGRVRKSGYQIWRNVVWAAKRTGLPDAWKLTYDWALKAADKYDALEESLERTWNSDQMDKGVVTGPGTLVFTARRYAPVKKRGALTGFHFLSEAEVCQLEGRRPPAEDDDTALFDYFGNLIFQEDEDAITADLMGHDILDNDDCDEGDCDEADEEDADGAEQDDRDSGQFVADYGEDYPDAKKFYKNLRQMPPGPFGSPIGNLPDGYSKASVGAGFGYIHTTSNEEDEPIKIWKRLCFCDVEFLEQRFYLDHEGVKVREAFVFRKYNEKTGRAEPPFEVRGADMADQTTLMRTLRDVGIRYSNDKGAETKMRAYLSDLAAEGSMSKKPTLILEQAGWINEGRDFALGENILSLDPANANARIADAKKTLMDHIGETRGSLDMQLKVMDVFAREGCEINASLISLMMGAVISGLGPHKGGIVMTWQSDSGKGKTTTHRIGEAVYGRPGCLTEDGHSSLSTLEHRMVALCDLPTYMDDIKCPESTRDPAMKALRDFMLFVTAGKSKGRMDRSATRRITGLLGWNAPVFMTTNKSLPFVLGSSGGASTEATFARVLSVRYQTKALPPDVKVDGVPFDLAIMQNYGWLGRHWLKYIMENKEAIQRQLYELHTELQMASAEQGLAPVHRFHNSTIACGLLALHWLKSLGKLSWDFDKIQQTMIRLAYSEDEDIKDLNQNDPQNLWTEFLVQNQSNLIRTIQGGTRWDVPDDLARNRKGVIIRCEGAHAFIKRIALRRFCNEMGMPPDTLLRWIQEEYGPVLTSKVAKDLAQGTKCPRQMTFFYRVPLDAVAATEEGAESQKDNVVPLRAREPQVDKALQPLRPPQNNW